MAASHRDGRIRDARGNPPPVQSPGVFHGYSLPEYLGPERIPGAASSEMLAVGLALRFAYVGVGAVVAGAVALIDGGMTPLYAGVLALGGAGVALASIGYLQRWTRGLDAPAAPRANAPRVDRTSMHQPV